MTDPKYRRMAEAAIEAVANSDSVPSDFGQGWYFATSERAAQLVEQVAQAIEAAEGRDSDA